MSTSSPSAPPATAMNGGSPARFGAAIARLVTHLHLGIQGMNTSKVFAGLMIITLNVASKFVTIKMSKTMEAYLKYSFSRDALIFAIAWVGSRDIYVAISITLLFVICMDFLFNEESAYCVFPEAFCDYHIKLLEGAANEAIVSPEEVKKAHEIIEKAAKQNTATTSPSVPPASPASPIASMPSAASSTSTGSFSPLPVASPPPIVGESLLAMSSSNTYASPYQSGGVGGL